MDNGEQLPGAPPPAGGRALPPHLDPRRGRPARPPRPGRTSVPGSTRVQTQRRSPVLRALAILAAISSFAVVATAGVGYALVNNINDRVGRLANVFPNATTEGRPPPTPRDAQNVLIVGSDSRGNLGSGEGTQGTGKTFVKGQRSDTMILAHLYGDSDQAELVSFPRDSWVPVPAHVDPVTGKQVPEQDGKLNSSFERGGPALLIQTIEQLSQLRVDSYLQIDFDGFQKMVNTLGGVEVCLSKPAKEKDSGINLPAGRQTIQGDQALAFVRQRKKLANGDLDRIRRQQQFIGAIVRKTLSAGTLLNPLKLNDLLGVAADSVQVDDQTSKSDLKDLALRFRSFDAGGVAFTTVPVANISATRDRQSVVLLDDAKAEALFERLRQDRAPGTPAPSSSPTVPRQPLTVAPGKVQVKVFNGAGISGLGKRGADELAAAGFTVVGGPANRGTGATVTTVLYGPDKADSARTLAAAVPGATTTLDPSLTDTLQIVLGAEYTGAQTVTVGSAPAPTAPKPAASATAKPVTAAQDPCAP